MRSYRVEGIIISRRNVGEADRLLTVLTREEGKVRVKAVGVRRITSRRGSHIELLNTSILHLYRGRGMPILTEVVSIEDFSEIKQDLRLIGFAYYVCELMESLCPENQENRQAYFLLKEFLSRLSGVSNVVESVYVFENELLKLLGYWTHERELSHAQSVSLIENILERRLKSRQIISRFY